MNRRVENVYFNFLYKLINQLFIGVYYFNLYSDDTAHRKTRKLIREQQKGRPSFFFAFSFCTKPYIQVNYYKSVHKFPVFRQLTVKPIN